MNIKESSTYINKAIIACEKGENNFENSLWVNKIKTEFQDVFRFDKDNKLYQMLTFYSDSNHTIFEFKYDTDFEFKISQYMIEDTYKVYIDISKHSIIFLSLELDYKTYNSKDKQIDSMTFEKFDYNIKSLYNTFDIMEKTKYYSIFELYIERLNSIAIELQNACKKSDIYRSK